jgi:hypothetical protein
VRERLFTLRLSDEEYDKLLRLVEMANVKAEALGLPAEVTPSSLLRGYIAREDGETEPTLQVRAAPNVEASKRKLREGRTR